MTYRPLLGGLFLFYYYVILVNQAIGMERLADGKEGAFGQTCGGVSGGTGP